MVGANYFQRMRRITGPGSYTRHQDAPDFLKNPLPFGAFARISVALPPWLRLYATEAGDFHHAKTGNRGAWRRAGWLRVIGIGHCAYVCFAGAVSIIHVPAIG